jgi:hypothetical protein
VAGGERGACRDRFFFFFMRAHASLGCKVVCFEISSSSTSTVPGSAPRRFADPVKYAAAFVICAPALRWVQKTLD